MVSVNLLLKVVLHQNYIDYMRSAIYAHENIKSYSSKQKMTI